MTRTFVPNIGPSNAKIACIGEGPGEYEEKYKIPFHPDAPAGEMLTNVLQRNALFRDEVWLGNLTHYRPHITNKFILARPEDVESGVAGLAQNLARIRPNVIAAMGAWPLWYLTGKCGYERGKPKPGTGIENYRGSILPCILPGCEGLKVIATYHPSYVARNRTKYPIFDIDIARIKGDSKFPELNLPKLTMTIDPRGEQLKDCVDKIIKSGLVAADIEAIKHTTHILCYGFAISPEEAICIVNRAHSFEFKWAVDKILSSGVKLIWHNGPYDQIISEANGFKIKNYFWDTMVAQHVMQPEMPRSLAYITSVNTREPYYKDETKGDEDTKSWTYKWWSIPENRKKVYRYNCKDDARTFENYLVQKKEFGSGPRGWIPTFEFEMSEIPVGVRISQAGMLRDEKKHRELKAALLYIWADFQSALNNLVGRKTNTNSSKQMCILLYDELGLKEKRKRDKNGKWVRTADEDALVSLVGEAKEQYDNRVQKSVKERWLKALVICKLTMKIRGVRKVLSSYVNVEISEDGRARGFVKITGAETGRWSMSKYYDNTGIPMQTVPRDPVELEDESVLENIDGLLELEAVLK
ncbi:MAG TPA: hypothetical protein ENI23_02070 [bacterium]|nr:hypothetical protein [bacterium]